MSGELIVYDAACTAIAAAVAIDEVKDIRDKADAMRLYARQAKNKALEVDAAEIRILAERRLGEMIAHQKKTVGLNPGAAGAAGPGRGNKNAVPKKNRVLPPTLAQGGIDKKLSSRAQKLAAIPDDKFAALKADWRERVEQDNERVTTTLARDGNRPPPAVQTQEYEGCSVDDLQTLIEQGRKYSVIYADPPWSFKVYSGKGKARSAETKYDTLDLDGIKAFREQIEALASPDCALFMWAVMPQLPEALEVIEAWGFKSKPAGFTWVKQNPSGDGYFTGMGYWTRANAELCLLATRGSPHRIHKDVRQLIVCARAAHSEKPVEIHHRIERLLPGPYLEMFGRRPCPGWTVWGNEIDRNLFYENLESAA